LLVLYAVKVGAHPSEPVGDPVMITAPPPFWEVAKPEANIA
jgi:hypothetical protein